ncbi:arsenate reductase family protein [Paenisporosarcina cavernae]|uniref:Arsenate reductase family protein n=1 Tax=Paenisporosarcina cavernae TaxID=2320858 RepID=A0A385YWY7_9BACL|nr:arsenate reductase family protein [Paenisporosarcina cavernae]AYC30053.1 arsenate reductase family protein [Paenisporosarcina cavernae]
MKVTIYEYPKCGTCRKAKKWLEEQGHEVEAIDLVKNTPSKETVQSIVASSEFPLKRFFNTSGNKYKELNLKEKLPTMTEEEQYDLLVSDGMLMKRPLVTDGKKVTLGFKESDFEENWKNA